MDATNDNTRVSRVATGDDSQERRLRAQPTL